MGSIGQQKEAHCVERKVRKASINQRQASSRGHESTLPRSSTLAHRGHQRLYISHSQLVIAHGKAQVGKRELALFTIEQSGHPSLLSLPDSHNNNFTLVEIDFHT
jgi:hypothetical protein